MGNRLKYGTTEWQEAVEEAQKKPKRSKYRAIRTKLDGITFPSKAEAARYAELKQLEASGQINSLERQVKYPLRVKDVTISSYIADFRYVEISSGQTIVEESKGVWTPLGRLKLKFFEAQYGIPVRVTGAAAKKGRKK